MLGSNKEKHFGGEHSWCVLRQGNPPLVISLTGCGNTLPDSTITLDVAGAK